MGKVARRSIVAARDLTAGSILSEADLDCIRPFDGLPPTALSSLIGKELIVPLLRHDRVLTEHVR